MGAVGVTAAMALAALALAAPAHAAAIEVSLRIEGRSTTLYEGPLRTDARSVNGGDGSGSHPCGGGRPSVLGALADAADRTGFAWRGDWNPDFQDFLVDRIGGDLSSTATAAFWAVLVDWRYSGGACATTLAAGDQVLWAYDTANRPLVLRLTGPARVAVGEPFGVEVRDGWLRADSGADGGPVAGATVGGSETDGGGHALLRFDTPGLKRLKAERGDAIRSNALDVCVGDAVCEGALPPPGTGGPVAPIQRRPSPLSTRTRTALRRAAHYLGRMRATRQLSPPVLRRVHRARVATRTVLTGRGEQPVGGRRLTYGELRRQLRCARPSGAIVCGRRAARRPVWSTARAVIDLATTLRARR